MKKDLVIKVCEKCGATVEILKDCTCENCGISCCGQPMHEVTPNSVDASKEKHLPVYEVVGNYIVATVNHVMEEAHHIEYIALVSDKINAKKYLKVGEPARVIFPYVKGAKLYASCNLHGIWETEVK